MLRLGGGSGRALAACCDELILRLGGGSGRALAACCDELILRLGGGSGRALAACCDETGHDIVMLPGGVSPQLPLGHGEPGDDVDWSEGRQLDVLVVRQRRR
jgi:hypothetical protein